MTPRTAVGPGSGADRTGRRGVAIGGGTGLAALLSGLKRHVGGAIVDLAAIVAVTDDGGSSGRLRRDFGVLPPGDIRNCIAALGDDTDLLTRLFQFRFEGGEGLSGHSFGNPFLAALTELTGDFPQAIATAERILTDRPRSPRRARGARRPRPGRRGARTLRSARRPLGQSAGTLPAAPYPGASTRASR